jgi:hypothetical protein
MRATRLTARAAPRLLLALAVLCTSACLRPTDATTSSVAMTGRWDYSTVQSGTPRETMTGTLLIDHQVGASIQGTVDVTARNVETGAVRSVVGTISGSAAEAGSIDFDVFLELKPRRHVAQLAGDSLIGTWVRLSDQGIAASGTFSARRAR